VAELTFGKWVRQQRIAKDMTATECAFRSKMAVQSWSRLEQGTRKRKDGTPVSPRRETIEAVARGLEIDVEEVARAAGVITESNLPEPSWIARYHDLPPDQREEVDELINMKWKRYVRNQTSHGRKAG
jgi:transcriptional regulator with XRE-family HTH domain